MVPQLSSRTYWKDLSSWKEKKSYIPVSTESTERVTIFYCTYCLFVNTYYYCIFVVSFLRFLGGGCRVLSLGVDSRLCSFTMYRSLSSRLTILLYWSSRRLRWEWMDSAPCSPIMPAPVCQRRIQGSQKVITAWTLDCASALNLLATAFTTNHVVTHEFHRLTQDIVTHNVGGMLLTDTFVASVSL